MRALQELEVAREQDHGLFVIPELGIGHPQTCLVDGLQIATGATYGKSLMERTHWGKLAAVFYHPRKGVCACSCGRSFWTSSMRSSSLPTEGEGPNHPRSQWRSQLRLLTGSILKPMSRSSR